MSTQPVTPTRVLLVDDHAMLREGLRRSLSAQGFDIVAEAGDGEEAIRTAEHHKPDVILMDVTMPVLGGIDATRRLRDRLPDVKVLMLTMHADPQLAVDAAQAGAVGYLVKDCTTADIVEAVATALEGGTSFPDAPTAAVPDNSTSRPVITSREAEVLQLIADGKTTPEAAKELYVSVKTVKNHLASAYAKLDAHDRTQAVLRAARLGLINLPGDT